VFAPHLRILAGEISVLSSDQLWALFIYDRFLGNTGKQDFPDAFLEGSDQKSEGKSIGLWYSSVPWYRLRESISRCRLISSLDGFARPDATLGHIFFGVVWDFLRFFAVGFAK